METRTKRSALWRGGLWTLTLLFPVFLIVFLNQSQQGRSVTTAVVRKFFALYGIQLTGGEVVLSPLGGSLRGGKLCFEATCGVAEKIELTLLPMKVSVTGLCPEFSGGNEPLTGKMVESVTTKLFQFKLPVQSLSISSSPGCEFTKGLELQIELADTLTVSIGGGEVLRAVREKDLFRLQGELGPVAINGELSSKLQLKLSGDYQGEQIHYSGSLSQNSDEFVGVLSGALTGSSTARFGSKPSIQFIQLRGEREGYLLSVDQILIDKSPTGIAGRIAGLSLQSPVGALKDGSVLVNCRGSEDPCQITNGAIRLIEIGAGIEVGKVSFGGEILNANSSPCIKLSELSALLWGGSLEASEFNLCDKESITRVAFKGIELVQPVTLLSGKRLQIEGEGSGELLFQLTPFRITSGKLSSTPGLLQYLDEAEMLPAIAREALQDLRFTTLNGDFSLREGNILAGSASIQGRSPLLNTPRPVNVNLQWESDIGKLLKLWKVGRELRESSSHNELGL